MTRIPWRPTALSVMNFGADRGNGAASIIVGCGIVGVVSLAVILSEVCNVSRIGGLTDRTANMLSDIDILSDLFACALIDRLSPNDVFSDSVPGLPSAVISSEMEISS